MASLVTGEQKISSHTNNHTITTTSSSSTIPTTTTATTTTTSSDETKTKQNSCQIEVANCQSRISKWLALIQRCKLQPLENSAGSKAYRDVLKVVFANAKNLDMISCKFTVTIDACIQKLETSQWAAALCKSVEKACEGLVSSGTVAAACSCGRNLRNDLLSALENVISSLQKQIDMAQQRLGDGNNLKLRKKLAVLTGQVSSDCKVITRLPTSNKACLKRKILNSYRQVTDIISEQEQMIADSMTSPRIDDDTSSKKEDQEQNDSFGMEDDFFFDDYDFTLSLKEIETSRSCVVAAKACEAFMKSLAKVVGKHISDTICSKDAIETIDRFIQLMTTFSNEVNELGVCLCPPQKQENIVGIMSVLNEVSVVMSSCLNTMLDVALDEKSNENDRLVVVEQVKKALEDLRSSTVPK